MARFLLIQAGQHAKHSPHSAVRHGVTRRRSRPARWESKSTAPSTCTPTSTSTDPRTTPTGLPGIGTTAKRANEASAEPRLDRAGEGPRARRLPPLARRRHRRRTWCTPASSSARPPVPRSGATSSRPRSSAKVPVGRGLVIEGGIYPSHIGFEGFASQGNWNYTRSWMGDFSPYYQTGHQGRLRVRRRLVGAAPPPERLAAHRGQQQRQGDRYAGRRGRPARARLTFNTFIGPELDNDNGDWRYFGDLVWLLDADRVDQARR